MPNEFFMKSARPNAALPSWIPGDTLIAFIASASSSILPNEVCVPLENSSIPPSNSKLAIKLIISTLYLFCISRSLT